MPASRQACPVGLWLATSTSICRRIATSCSALCFFLATLQPPLVPVSLTFPLVQNSPVRSGMQCFSRAESGSRCEAHSFRSPFQVGGPVGDEGERFGDGLRRNGVHYEFLAVGGNGVGSADTAHGGGFEQCVGRAQLQAGAL